MYSDPTKSLTDKTQITSFANGSLKNFYSIHYLDTRIKMGLNESWSVDVLFVCSDSKAYYQKTKLNLPHDE